MITLRHSQVVDTRPDAFWATTHDMYRIGACFPGAKTTEVDGDAYAGSLRVGVGPITLQFVGAGRVIQRDDESRTVTFSSSGRERRGLGGGDMTMRIHIEDVPERPTRARVTIRTDITVHNLPTPIGSGLAQAISDPLVARFLTCMAESDYPTPRSEGGDRLDAMRAVVPGLASYAGRLLRRG